MDNYKPQTGNYVMSRGYRVYTGRAGDLASLLMAVSGYIAPKTIIDLSIQCLL